MSLSHKSDGEAEKGTSATEKRGSANEATEEEPLECSLVLAGQRRCGGQLIATAHGLRFVPRSNPGDIVGTLPFCLPVLQVSTTSLSPRFD